MSCSCKIELRWRGSRPDNPAIVKCEECLKLIALGRAFLSEIERLEEKRKSCPPLGDSENERLADLKIISEGIDFGADI